MELNEKLHELAQRIGSIKESVTTEEATKTSMIMPFFQLLGYDVFNPKEFVPEFIADVGIKKGEKVDYAIVLDGEPLVLVECKPCNKPLEKHSSQLFRYFGTTSAKFAILTNGLTYQFFTDLDDKNKMDPRPFLTINLLSLQDRDIVEIEKFQKNVIDVDDILNSAENLKYTRLIKDYFVRNIESPSVEFVKSILNDVYKGVKTQKVIETFTPLVKKAVTQYINDSMNAKIKAALDNQDDIEPEPVAIESPEPDTPQTKEKKIDTTIEELEAYAIIKSILRTIVDGSRITYRDTESYFGILLDNNGRKWICRVYLRPAVKYLVISDDNKQGVRHDIECIDDIYNHAEELRASCQRYLDL